MELQPVIPMVVVAISAVVGGAIDARSFRIPNLLTIPLLIAGFVYHFATGGLGALESSVIGALFGFGVVVLMFVIGAMGAGDVKFMAAVGAWLGLPVTVYVFIVAALATAFYGLVVLALNGGLRVAFVTFYITLLQLGAIGRHLGAAERVDAVAKQSDRRKRLVPFATMVALGVFVVLAWMWLNVS